MATARAARSSCRSAGDGSHFTVAGVWRDYARPFGAIVISRPAYIEATGDGSANEGLRVARAGTPRRPTPRPHCARCFARPDALEILTSTALKRALAADLRSGLRHHLRARGHRGRSSGSRQ